MGWQNNVGWRAGTKIKPRAVRNNIGSWFQQLSPQIGTKSIKNYLADFKYGNQILVVMRVK